MEHRLLARRSEQGYTDHPSQAMGDEPEAVAEDVQEQLTARVHRVRHEQRRHTWQRTIGELRKQSDYHAQQARACEHQIARLQRKLRA